MSGETQNAATSFDADQWPALTEPFAAPLDVVGYNYFDARYAADGEAFPQRIICGTKSFPRSTTSSGSGSRPTATVIGDFTWTSFDYIGEAGIGKSVWLEEASPTPAMMMSHSSAFPWRTANDADFDICGFERPQLAYRPHRLGQRRDLYRRPRPGGLRQVRGRRPGRGLAAGPQPLELGRPGGPARAGLGLLPRGGGRAAAQRRQRGPRPGGQGRALHREVRAALRPRHPRGRGLYRRRGAQPPGSSPPPARRWACASPSSPASSRRGSSRWPTPPWRLSTPKAVASPTRRCAPRPPSPARPRCRPSPARAAADRGELHCRGLYGL